MLSMGIQEGFALSVVAPFSCKNPGGEMVSRDISKLE